MSELKKVRTYRELYQEGKKRLAAAGLAEADTDARLLLLYITGLRWNELLLRYEEPAAGDAAERYFAAAFGGTNGIVLYVVLYVSAIAVASLWDLFKNRDNPNYNALGASGAVSAVLFASILFDPKMGIYIYLIPIPVPGYIFAPLYLLYCWYMARRGTDNIGHTAHFWGAVYGLAFPLICRPDIFQHFLAQLGL